MSFVDLVSGSTVALAEPFSGEVMFRARLTAENLERVAACGVLYDLTDGDLANRIDLLRERAAEFRAAGPVPDRSAHVSRMEGELLLLEKLRERLASV